MMPASGSHEICRASGRALRPGEADYLVAVGRQEGKQCMTDQSAGTCQENAHRSNLQPAGERRGGSRMRKAFSPSQLEAHNTPVSQLDASFNAPVSIAVFLTLFWMWVEVRMIRPGGLS